MHQGNWYNQLIGLGGRVFAHGSGDLGSIPGRVIPKTLKMALDTSLLNTQQYKVRIKVKWNNSRKGVAPSPTPWWSSYWKGAFWSPLTTVANFTYFYYISQKYRHKNKHFLLEQIFDTKCFYNWSHILICWDNCICRE